MTEYLVDFVKKERVWVPDESKVGVAYAVFDSNAPEPELIGDIALNEAERIARKTGPSKLEIALTTVEDFREEDNQEFNDFCYDQSTFTKGTPEQVRNGEYKRLGDLKYIMQVASPGKTSLEMADYLGGVMDDVARTYDSGNPVHYSIIYRNPKDKQLDFKRE